MDPKERLKQLFDQGGSVVVNHNVPVQRYFRSGQEMMRMVRKLTTSLEGFLLKPAYVKVA